MPGGLWSRLTRRRTRVAQEREVEREQMTPAERRLDEESFEDRQADLASQAFLGGVDPQRLLPDDDPRHR